jgi:hypothetical protein
MPYPSYPLWFDYSNNIWWQESSEMFIRDYVKIVGHRSTSRKVKGSIPNGVIGIFHWHNPYGRTMALGLTQLVTEMSTRNISWEAKAAGA